MYVYFYLYIFLREIVLNKAVSTARKKLVSASLRICSLPPPSRNTPQLSPLNLLSLHSAPVRRCAPQPPHIQTSRRSSTSPPGTSPNLHRPASAIHVGTCAELLFSSLLTSRCGRARVRTWITSIPERPAAVLLLLPLLLPRRLRGDACRLFDLRSAAAADRRRLAASLAARRCCCCCQGGCRAGEQRLSSPSLPQCVCTCGTCSSQSKLTSFCCVA